MHIITQDNNIACIDDRHIMMLGSGTECKVVAFRQVLYEIKQYGMRTEKDTSDIAVLFEGTEEQCQQYLKALGKTLLLQKKAIRINIPERVEIQR